MSHKWNQNRSPYGNQSQRQSMNQFQGGGQFNSRGQFGGMKFLSGPGGAGLLGAAPVSLMSQRPGQRSGPPHRGKGHRPGPHGDRRSPQRDRNRNRDSQKRRRSSPRASPHKKRDSIDRRRPAPIPRYMVQYVRRPLTSVNAGVLDMKVMHSSMYIPSDFIDVKFNWQQSFSPKQHQPPRKCCFHILPKEAQFPNAEEQPGLFPSDVDYAWSAKVMLLQIPALSDMYRWCCKLAEDESKHFQHQTKLFKFLTGCKGKKEVMAIGGSWSPSLDGPDPSTNPQTLVNTAIRTCKALTGIDLSNCTNWRRVVEIQYHRDEEVRKGQTVPDRVETTVIFLPDIHSCLPTDAEYTELRKLYADTAEAVITEAEKIPEPVAEVEPEPLSTTATESAEISDQHDQKEDQEKEEKQQETMEVDESAEAVDSENDENKLDVKSLKVHELRKELVARGLSSRGLKGDLVARLLEAIEAEEEAKKNPPETKEETEETKAEESTTEENHDKDTDKDAEKNGEVKEEKETTPADEKKDENKEEDAKSCGEAEKVEEKEKEEEKPKVDKEKIRKLWTLPEHKSVIPVHPNSTYKKGTYGCVLTSLASLLDYRLEDNKETIFEVSVFAEAFHDMLQRDHALNIYRALCNPLPPVKVEEAENKTDDKEENDADKTKDDDAADKAKENDGEPPAKRVKSDIEAENAEEKVKENGKEDDEADDEESATKKDSDSPTKEKVLDSEKKDGEEKTKAPETPKVEDPKVEEKKITFRKDLLLSFAFFDQTLCGYIRGNDMADILHSLDLGLSRSQITKILSDFLDQDELRYRKLTDIPASSLEQYMQLLEESNKKDLDTLLAGNKDLLPTAKVDEKMDTKEDNGIVTYNGTVIDVKALQSRLIQNESTIADMEANVKKLNFELGSVTKNFNKTTADMECLQESHVKLKVELDAMKGDLKSTTDTKSRYEKALLNVKRVAEGVLPKEEKSVENVKSE